MKNENPVSARNPAIELFRIFCMLAICMQHAVVFSNTGSTGFESRYWNIGVVGFAFITGYYGTSFKIKKILVMSQSWGWERRISGAVEPSALLAA